MWLSGGGEDQQGIYSLLFGRLIKAADLNSSIPDGTGTFISFTPLENFIPPGPSSGHAPIFGANIAFLGTGTDGQWGIYVAIPSEPTGSLPSLIKVVDLNTPIPGGTDDFTSFPLYPTLSGLNAAFIGYGADGQQGIYLSIPTFPESSLVPVYPTLPLMVADTNTPVPGAPETTFTSLFIQHPPNPCLSGDNLVFIGNSPSGSGIYGAVGAGPQPWTPFRIVDFTTPVPNTDPVLNFTNFNAISLSGSNLAFVGSVSQTLIEGGTSTLQEGVYRVRFPNGSTPGTNPVPIADLDTLVPGGVPAQTFIAFGKASIDQIYVTFDAWSSPDGVNIVHGIYTDRTGVLTTVVDNTQSILGKQLSDFSFGAGGFNGNQIVFNSEFADGSQGITEATISGDRCPASQGFWKNNPSLWPASSMFLGNQSYSKAELLTILSSPSTSDASLVLARQLIAAKLNILSFSNPAPVASTIADSDRLLTPYGGKLPYSVKTNTTSGKAMVHDSSTLSSYNQDKLTPECAP